MFSAENMRGMVPAAVVEVCATLRASGFQAWVVGGAVRDMVLGKIPSDWDVASDALPERVLELFDKTIATGLQHGTVTAVVGRGRNRSHVEITSFRGEGAYSDSRRPDTVHFGVALDEDLKRRDFVMNAMAYDPIEGKIHDPFGGVADLDAGIVRAVGDPSERFNEDGLRVLRAVRFLSTLDFELQTETEAGIGSALEALSKVAQERVRVELTKLLGGVAPARALRVARRSGVLQVCLPELEPSDDEAAFARAAIPADTLVRLAALLRAVPMEALELLLRRLTMSNEERQRVLAMLRHQADFQAACGNDLLLRKHLSLVSRKAALQHLAVLEAEALRANDSEARTGIARSRAILSSGVALEIRDMAIDGATVMRVTGATGPRVGEILRSLLDTVLQDPAANERLKLESLARESGTEAIKGSD